MELRYDRAPWPFTRQADYNVRLDCEMIGVEPNVSTIYDPRRRDEVPHVSVHREGWENLTFDGTDEIINSMHRLVEEEATYQYIGTEWRTDNQSNHEHEYLLIDVDTDERGVIREAIPVSNIELEASLSVPDAGIEFYQSTRIPRIGGPLNAAFVTARRDTLNVYYPIDSRSYVRLFWNTRHETKYWRIREIGSMLNLEAKVTDRYDERVIWRQTENEPRRPTRR